MNKNSKQQSNKSSPKNTTFEPEVIAENVTLKELTPQKLKGWKIKSAITKFFKKNNLIECNDIELDLITQNDEIAHLKSDKTKINVKTKDVILEGSVTGNFNDFKLIGKNFSYNFDKHLIKSEADVTVQHPQLKISSKNTSINLKEQKIILSGGVTSEFFNTSEQPQKQSKN